MTRFLKGPQQIVRKGRALTRAGRGNVPGATRYKCALSGWSGDFPFARVVSTGSFYAKLELTHDPSFGPVRLHNPPGWLKAGHYVVIAPPVSEPGGAVTDSVFPAAVEEREKPRKVGTIYKCLNPRCGFVRNGDGTESRVDIEAFLDTCHGIAEGQRISYREEATPRGFKAVEVRWA